MKAIEFENVGKMYRLGRVGTGTLSHDLNRWWQTSILGKEDPYLKIGQTNDRTTKGSSEYVWALKDINFSIEQGDVVGIIGKNGAGKSTLLKLLSNITSPTTGSIRYNGRIASLLEVGTGFHPELTARENIYMNGSIMGMTKAEITRKLDEIVDFAGVERYLDTPVKRFSSGMTVRLGFAVAAFLEPEILVVDEVLAVGDAEFQKKAIGKMQDVSSKNGRTVLFVSHNMSAIKRLCKTGMVLDKGMVDYIGDTDTAIGHYLGHNVLHKEGEIKDAIKEIKSYLKIFNISINGKTCNKVNIPLNSSHIDLEIHGHTQEKLNAEIKFFLRNKNDECVASLIEGRYRGTTQLIEPGDFCINKHIKLPRYMAEGNFYIDLYMHQPMIDNFFFAPHCVDIHFDGGFDGEGKPIEGWKDGLFGFECDY